MYYNTQDENGGNGPVPKITVITLLAVSVLLAALSSAAPIGFFGVLLTAASAAATAFACGAVGSFLPLAVSAAAYLTALLFFGKPLEAAAALAFLPCAFMMADARKRRRSRSETILALSLVLGAAYIAYIALYIAIKRGGLSVAVIKEEFDLYTAGIGEIFSALGFSEENKNSLVGMLMAVSPSLAVYQLMFTAYFTTVFYSALCRMFRLEDKLLPVPPWQFSMSWVSACVFMAAYIISVLFSTGRVSPLSLTAENIIIILTPGFAVVGAGRAVLRVKERNGNFITAVLAVAAFALLFINLQMFLSLISFFGVIETIMDGIKRRMSGMK